MASKLYSLSAADNYIQKVSNELLDIITIPGSLLDTYILIHISGVVEVLEETYLNCWSSAYKRHIYRKRIPTRYKDILSEYGY